MRLRSVSLSQLLPLAAALTAGLIGCGDTVVPALDEAERRLENGDGGSEVAGPDTCFLSILYKVEGDQYRPKGGGQGPIDPRRAGLGSPCSILGSTNAPSLEVCHVDGGNDGHAKLLWNNEVVAEVTIDEAFYTSGRTAVLAYDAGDAGYFEYRMFTRRSCDSLFPGPLLTREEVTEFEDGARGP